MNENENIRSGKRGLAVMVVAALGASCATQPREKAPVNEAEACTALKSVIAAAPHGFDAVKRRPSQHALGERWEAQGILPRTTCEVLKWAAGYSHYLCMWNPANEAAAKQDFEEGKRVVGACLGDAWKMTEEPAKTGRMAVYAAPQTETRVSLRFFSDPRGYRTSWQTSLIVGDKLKDSGLLYQPTP